MATILTRAQRRLFHLLLGLAIFLLANSAYLLWTDPKERLTVFYQLMLIAHLGGGTLLLILATLFLIWHLRRVGRYMRFSANASGIGLTIAAYALFATGLYIFDRSNARANRWVFLTHQLLAILAPLLYGVHRWVSHFPPRARVAKRSAIAFVLLFMALVGLGWGLAPSSKTEAEPAARRVDPFLPFAPKNFPNQASPFFPSSSTTDSGGFFPARILTRDERGDFERIRSDVEKLGFAAGTTIGSETCRRCHPDIVAQWEDSAHRFSSFNNPFYRASVDALREQAGFKPSQWCAGCHDPAVMFAGNMTKPIDPLTPESQAGLTCLACHAIDEIHGREGNGNYNLSDEQPSPYLGDNASKGWKRWLADQLIKSKPAAHKRRFLKPIFRKPEFCAACHKVSIDLPVNGYRWLRGQDEYDHWQDSGVSHNAARTFYLPPHPFRCQDCHMPPESAPLGDVSAKNGLVRSHRFIAVNTALPYIRGDFETIRRIERFLHADKLRIDVFAVDLPDGATIRALDRARPALPAEKELVFEVVVRNAGVGHTFPGGTNDSNQGWIEFTVLDRNEKVLFRSGAIDDQGYVDEKAHFYRVVMVRHDGSEADRRDAQTFHVAAFSRTIAPGTADVARYAVTLPPALEGQTVTLRARLLWRKFNRKYTVFTFTRPGIKVPDLPHLKGAKIPALPVTEIARSEVALQVGATEGAPHPVTDPTLWQRYNDHGIASLLQGAFDVAAASFAEVARLRPDLPDGWRNLARRWINSAEPEKAEPYLRRMDAAAPTDPQRPYFWGRYFERMELYEQAEEAYVASLQVFPADRDGWRHLGAVRYKLHHYEQSLKAYLKALEIDPEDLEAHKRRLDIYRQLGREQDAAEARKAFDKYKRDEQAEEVARDFLLRHPEINHEAQPRHLHRLHR